MLHVRDNDTCYRLAVCLAGKTSVTLSIINETP